MLHKFSTLLAIALLGCCLYAQPTIPRALVIRLVNADGSSACPDTSGLSYEATLLGQRRTDKSHSLSFFHAENSMFALMNLGNFGVQWEPGDTIRVSFTKQDSIFLMGSVEITIPEGTYTIWWGRQGSDGTDYPGEPVRLYPMIIIATAPDPGIPVLVNGRDTDLITCIPAFAKTKDDITGIFSLAPPPSGWRWEPSKYVLTPRDFEFSESASTDAEGVARPGWARTLEFRLVPEE